MGDQDTGAESSDTGIDGEGSVGSGAEGSGGEGAGEALIELDGVQYTGQQLRDMRDGGLRQSDYTRKTQDLAVQKNRYADLEERALKVVETIEKRSTGSQGKTEEKLETAEDWKTHMVKVAREVAREISDESAEKQSVLTSFKNRYPDWDEQWKSGAINRHMKANPGFTPVTAFLDMKAQAAVSSNSEAEKVAKEKAKSDSEKAAKAKKSVKVLTQGGGGGSPGSQKREPLTGQARTNAVLEHLAQMRGGK